MGELPRAMIPDYRLPYGEVFRNITRLMILDSCDLDALRGIYYRPESIHLPSWVQRFQVKFGDDDHKEARDQDVSASRGINLDTELISTPRNLNVLNLKGITLSSITQLSEVIRRETFVQNGVAAIEKLLDTIEEMVENSGDRSDYHRDQIISFTLCNGLDGHAFPIDGATCLDLYKEFGIAVRELKFMPRHLSQLTPADSPASKMASNYWQAVCNSCFQIRLYVTKCGKIGRAPASTQVGDIVVVLFGSRYPFVLRPVPLIPRRFELVGYCFTYGIMYGEAIEEWRATSRDAEVYDLQ